MKRGFHFHGLRRKRLSLFSICIMSTTIIILSWEKTPSLTALLPPYPDMLLPSEILSSWSIDEDSEELEDGENNGLPILSSLTKTEAKKNNEIEFEEDKTSEEDRTDFVMDTPQNGPLIKGEDANFGNNATDIEEIMSSLSDEEAKDLLEDGEIKSVPALSSDQTKTSTKRNENDGNKTSETEKQGTYEAKGSQEENRSFISGEDTNNGNNTTENEEILTSLSVEEAKVDLIQDRKIHGSPIVINIETRRNEIDGEKILEQENETTNFITESPQNRSSTSGEDASNWNDATKSKDCNYAKGKWVVDNDRPLYSGFGCKRWLSGMWACRLTQRTDFDYENLRWQPKDCHLEEFQASKFLRRLQNKTLAFVGDSLGRQQFQSLMCMITGGEDTNDVQDIGNEYGLVLHEGATHPHGWAYHFSSTNTTILYYWSSTLCETEQIDPNNPEAGIAMHLDRPTPFLREYLHKLDVLVLNTGHHWNRGKLRANKWVMHVGGVPNNDKNLAVIWHAKNLTVHSVVRWLNSELPKYPNLKVFYRTISPRHFVGGDWDTGGSCNNTKPMSVGKEILLEDSMDRAAASAVKGTGVKLLDITAISQLRDEGHISRFRITINSGVQDCLHWCLPGVPDTWNELLFAQI